MRRIIVTPCLVAVLLVAGCSRQEAEWQRAEREKTAAAYQAYVDRFPMGAHAAEARARLAEVRETEAWARAERLRTPEAWQRYLADWPQGLHADRARRSLVEFIPTETPSAGSAGSGFEIQLGAWSDEAQARAALRSWRGRQADLGGQEARLVAPPPGGSPIWRLRAGPLDEAAARVVCEDLKSAGTDCVPVAADPTKRN